MRLREREMRIVELSGHLLKAQEEERKRISRELHDETGQALMVIRLYLGMLDGTVKTREAKAKIGELLAVVDRTIEGIRRIIGRLSPLVLQELGLISAIRKEAKDLDKTAGVQARVAISDNVGRLDPVIETAIYRVVQESLHNVAKHAQAQNVDIQMERKGETLQVGDRRRRHGHSPGDQSAAAFLRNGRNAGAHQHPGRPDESGFAQGRGNQDFHYRAAPGAHGKGGEESQGAGTDRR